METSSNSFTIPRRTSDITCYHSAPQSDPHLNGCPSWRSLPHSSALPWQMQSSAETATAKHIETWPPGQAPGARWNDGYMAIYVYIYVYIYIFKCVYKYVWLYDIQKRYIYIHMYMTNTNFLDTSQRSMSLICETCVPLCGYIEVAQDASKGGQIITT